MGLTSDGAMLRGIMTTPRNLENTGAARQNEKGLGREGTVETPTSAHRCGVGEVGSGGLGAGCGIMLWMGKGMRG